MDKNYKAAVRQKGHYMKLGVMVHLNGTNIDEKFKQVYDFGFHYCQLCAWDHDLYTEQIAQQILAACEKYDVKITTFWCGWSGPTAWNFTEGPQTLGIVPEAYRFIRMKELIHGSEYAKRLGVKNVATHVGFIPENPSTELYASVVAAIRVVANHCKANGQNFLFETGQETPVTLLRTIEDVGTGNLGINLDPANLILYGKANPVDALTVFGKYVMDIHGKDGNYPTDGKNLGEETPIGKGSVNFPAFVAKLKQIGYDGTIIIEREIWGEQQTKDIIESKSYLEELI